MRTNKFFLLIKRLRTSDAVIWKNCIYKVTEHVSIDNWMLISNERLDEFIQLSS